MLSIKSSHNHKGQYMVEFAMTFIFFIGVTLAVINMILMAYNFNLCQRVIWEVARKASLGADNGALKQMIYDDLITKFFASPFLVSAIEVDRTSFVMPNSLSERVQGAEVTINFAYRSGFAFLEGSGIYARFPVKTSLIVIARNDEDRDGYYDTSVAGTLNDSRTYDHDNDSNADINDNDDDGDLLLDSVDTGQLRYNSITGNYEISTTGSPAFVAATGTINNTSSPFYGMFFSRVLNMSDKGVAIAGPYPLTPQKIPRNYIAPGVSIITKVDLSWDRNNNGWDDWAE